MADHLGVTVKTIEYRLLKAREALPPAPVPVLEAEVIHEE